MMMMKKKIASFYLVFTFLTLFVVVISGQFSIRNFLKKSNLQERVKHSVQFKEHRAVTLKQRRRRTRSMHE